MKSAEKFTVLELWQEREFPYIYFLLVHAGVNIASSYEARYNERAKKVEVYEGNPGRTFMVNQYPESFKKQANRILNRLQKKYKNQYPKPEPKKKTAPEKKRSRVKRQRVNSGRRYVKN